MKKKAISLLIAGLMVLEPCTMAGAADFSDAEVISQNAETNESEGSDDIAVIDESTEELSENEEELSISDEAASDSEELSIDAGSQDAEQGETSEFGDGNNEDFSDNTVSAAEAGAGILKSGRLSNSVTWDAYDNGELVITGTGEMPALPDGMFAQPWAYLGNITKVKVSDGITSIGENAFAYMLDLKEAELGKDIKKIGADAFYNDSALEKINLPENLTSIGTEAFMFCAKLKGELKFPETLTSVGAEAFNGCDELTSIVLPKSLKELPTGAFHYDWGIKRIVIPVTLTKIGANAFEGCWPSIVQYTGTQEQWKKLNFHVFDNAIELEQLNLIYNFNMAEVDEHIWSQEREWDGDEPLDCTVSRTQSYHCIICGAIDESSTVTIPGKAHTWSSELKYDEKNSLDVLYDCTKGGTKSRHCTKCGAIDKDSTVELPIRSAHDFGAWEVLQEATLTQEKITRRRCKVCDVSEEEVGKKLSPYAKVTKTAYTLNPQQKLTTLSVKYVKGDSVVSWKSSNTKVATVTKGSNGKCTVVAGKTPGKATLIVKLKSKKTAKVTITVRSVKTTKITGVKSSIALKVKKNAILKPVLTPKNSTEKITYKSSNTKIATVSSAGKITAKKKGTAYIYVKSGSKTVKCKVVVK